MDYTIELNNARKDADFVSGKTSVKSPVVEVFSAMVDGKDVGSVCKDADKYVTGIKELNARAEAGDLTARAEINNIKKFVYDPIVQNELKLLSAFGRFEKIGFGESAEIEVYDVVGAEGRKQAEGTDLTFGQTVKARKPIATTVISGGHKVNYRAAMSGDFSNENAAKEAIVTDIRNKAMQYAIKTIYDRIKGATGVKYFYENATLAKSSVDEIIKKVARIGKPSLVGDREVLAQLTSWAGYFGNDGGSSKTINDIAPSALEAFYRNGILERYMSYPMVEVSAQYDFNKMNATGDNFDLLTPSGLLLVLPQGAQSPVKSVVRGNLTSLTGTDVINGELISRFDIEIGTEVAHGREFMMGAINDSDAEGSAILA